MSAMSLVSSSGSTGEGSDFKLIHVVVNMTRFLKGCWTESWVPHWQLPGGCLQFLDLLASSNGPGLHQNSQARGPKRTYKHGGNHSLLQVNLGSDITSHVAYSYRLETGRAAWPTLRKRGLHKDTITRSQVTGCFPPKGGPFFVHCLMPYSSLITTLDSVLTHNSVFSIIAPLCLSRETSHTFVVEVISLSPLVSQQCVPLKLGHDRMCCRHTKEKIPVCLRCSIVQVPHWQSAPRSWSLIREDVNAVN